ncbi:hypothetical protein ACE7GA_25765 [Roseomonas sp. CCTCC AB2023176]|uniref:hypothetical protein n=1 Tax=Roseomonas sp. CCTCC AB2023176 TaxID=3342640 RepID=UPI0035D5BA6C
MATYAGTGAEVLGKMDGGPPYDQQPETPPLAHDGSVRIDDEVQLRLAQETQTVLRDLAKKQGVTMTEIIRRGIGAMQFFERELKSGDRLVIEGEDGKGRLVLLPWKR